MFKGCHWDAAPLQYASKVIREPLLGTAHGALTLFEFAIQQLSWQAVGGHPDNMTNPAELPLVEDVFQ